MSLSALGEPQPLLAVIHNVSKTAGTWFYVDASTNEVTAALLCFPRIIDLRDMSESEIDEMEDAIRAAGFKSFLCSDQVEDVLSNLRQQRANATDADVIEAIDFYWKNDAFMVADGSAT